MTLSGRTELINNVARIGEAKFRIMAREIHTAWKNNMKVKTGRARASILVNRDIPNTESTEETAITVQALQSRQNASRNIINQWSRTNRFTIVESTTIPYYDNAETINALPRAVVTGIAIASAARI